jgi:hypothetical protein
MTDDEVLAYAQRLRADAIVSREKYPDAFLPDPNWDNLDQFNKDGWIRLARALGPIGGEA